MENKPDPSGNKEAADHWVDLLASDSAERVRFALTAAHMGVFEWDPNSDRLTWSSSTTGLGLNLDEAPTSGRAFFEFVHPDDRPAVSETRDRALRDRTDAVSTFRILSPDGVVHWVQAHGRIVYDPDGKPLRVLGVNTDITHRRPLDEQLRNAEIEDVRLTVHKATMRKVEHIVSNALMSLYLFRAEAEPHVSPTSLELFDRIIAIAADRLRALSDLSHID